jgi:triosephosphate isomerase (TIM)
MRRKPLIAGNWKMYKTRDEALAFIYAVNVEVP